MFALIFLILASCCFDTEKRLDRHVSVLKEIENMALKKLDDGEGMRMQKERAEKIALDL